MEQKRSNGRNGKDHDMHDCCHGWQGGGHHYWLRLILMIAVIVFVFGLGIKLGELKASVYYGAGGYGDSFYGRHMPMMGGYYYGTGGYGPMMQYYGPSATSTK